jgi:hypothetical protein
MYQTAKIESLKHISMKIEKRIQSLDSTTNQDFANLQDQLSAYHLALKHPILDRVFQLSGLTGSSMTSLQLKISDGTAIVQENSDKQYRFIKVLQMFLRLDRMSLSTGKLGSYRKLLSSPINPFKSKIGRKDPGSGAKPLTISGSDSLQPGVAQISKAEVIRRRPKSVETSPDGTSTIGPVTRQEVISGADKENEGDALIGPELYRDVMDVTKEIMLKGRVESWKAFEEKLIEFQAGVRPIVGSNFKRGFLESVYLLADIIHNYQLLRPDFVPNTSALFQKETLLKMILFDLDLRFCKGKTHFFEIPQSIIPQFEFLTSSSAFEHFHWPIKGPFFFFFSFPFVFQQDKK